jgi:hypothetical protein
MANSVLISLTNQLSVNHSLNQTLSSERLVQDLTTVTFTALFNVWTWVSIEARPKEAGKKEVFCLKTVSLAKVI